jgi:hypothetical protein
LRGRQTRPFNGGIEEFPRIADGRALHEEILHDDDADDGVDDDGGAEEVDLSFRFRPLEECDGQTGFHDAGEDHVDDFEEEYELWRVRTVLPGAGRWGWKEGIPLSFV